jgi:uncharacterized protein (DUF1800 family)
MEQTLGAALAANRFGFGARPGEIAALNGDARAALELQLRAGPPLLKARLPSSAEIVVEASELAQERRRTRNQQKDAMSPNAVPIGVKLVQQMRPIYMDEVAARFAAAVSTTSSFVERLVHFWSNHFAVSVDKITTLGLAGAMEREAIRPHVLGRFTDMLLAVERHPAMLLYLDNHVSIGPNSSAAQRVARRSQRQVGLNENLAREILELHTLGVDGGYSQQDVTRFAAMITGWSIGGRIGPLRGGTPGEFYFREEFHQPGAKILLGRSYAQEGYRQGAQALSDLAAHPSTARHIAGKLARHFVADDPPPALVERLTRAFAQSGGDLPSVYRALLDAPEAWASEQRKFKTPAEYIYSTYRALQLPVEGARAAVAPFELLGQRCFAPGSPAGWPDRSADWDGAAQLLKRLEWAETLAARVGSRSNAATLAPQVLGATLTAETRSAILRAQDGPQALTLLLASPEFMRR